jgi:hypothetical protein
MCINCMYQAGHVYVYANNTHIHDLFGRQFIHIYMTCLVQAIYTHIHYLLGICNLYTYA